MSNTNLIKLVVKPGRRVSLSLHGRRYSAGEAFEVDPITAEGLIRSGFVMECPSDDDDHTAAASATIA
ncbi:hypothetical protein PI86_10990 [Burkholderia sp. A9]|uniref:hypothetical protein n=1 Tax=Burkholderia sp. A9 TaxID=1365108 RepID=UPI000573F212|nr:hypothetical protein [Burkholderia sp. A9]KHK58131.1 hypothetical protein PI86_10990 [Burkholderia sp. A9]